MWLPKEKRILLVHYASKAVVGSGLHFEMNEAIDWLHREGVEDADAKSVYKANNTLRRRELLMECDRGGSCNGKDIRITLSQEGYDLGRKYGSWWTASGLWFAEYRHHWIWVIMGFIGGMIATLLVQVLLRLII